MEGSLDPGKVFASGPIMEAIQTAEIFLDSKSFVDMPLLVGLATAMADFSALGNHPAKDALQNFVDSNFAAAGSDLEVCVPVDWREDADRPLLPGISQGTAAKDWAIHIHSLWKDLCRKVTSVDSDRQSVLRVPHPFIIAGSRFRELYYWDNHFILKGLLVSGMQQSARAVVVNIVSLVKAWGHMPNGSRTYYLNRSQPPLLSQMVAEVSGGQDGLQLLREALPALEREHQYFHRKHVTIRGPDGRTHRLARYCADWKRPRPESYREDVETALSVSGRAAAGVYQDIASAAESGWDFSSRWFGDGHSMSTIQTTLVVPADLNGFLYQMETNMSQFYARLGDAARTSHFSSLAEQRLAAIETLMWNEAAGCWNDLLLVEPAAPGGDYTATPNVAMFASNFIPLWCGCATSVPQAQQSVVAGLKRSGLIKSGGIATSLATTGQQWDGDNGWPCLQCMIIEGLSKNGGSAGQQLAADLAMRWLSNNHRGWRSSGVMMEKYDVATPGKAGGGGEYEVQTGFGWTNGVALWVMQEFPEAARQLTA